MSISAATTGTLAEVCIQQTYMQHHYYTATCCSASRTNAVFQKLRIQQQQHYRATNESSSLGTDGRDDLNKDLNPRTPTGRTGVCRRGLQEPAMVAADGCVWLSAGECGVYCV